MAEELKKVFGFAVIKGSKDLPTNYPYESEFGFMDGSETPVFKYSLKEVHEGIENPVLIDTIGQIFDSQILRLAVEAKDNIALKEQDVTSDDWKNALKIIEYVAGFQAVIAAQQTWGNTEEDKKNYTNWLDYVFRTIKLPENKYPDYQSCYIPNYISKSSFFEKSRKSNRIQYVEFSVKMNEVPKAFKIYFDADSFMEIYASDRFFVYYYQDLDDNDKISQEEFDKQIVDKMNTGLMRNVWKSYKTLITPYCARYFDDEGSLAHKPAVNRTFYVYSNLPEDQFTQEILIEKIKQKLIEDNGNSEDDLYNQYPNLFTAQQVLIYPIHDNTATSATEGEITVAPVEYGKIQEIMRRFGIPTITSANDYRKTEIFYVGMDQNINLNNKYIYPLLAIDYSASKNSTPISSRFIKYSPRAFVNYDGTGLEDDKFQFILLQILGYFEKALTDEQLKTSLNQIDSTLDLKITESDGGDPKVSFIMKLTEFNVIWYTAI